MTDQTPMVHFEGPVYDIDALLDLLQMIDDGSDPEPFPGLPEQDSVGWDEIPMALCLGAAFPRTSTELAAISCPKCLKMRAAAVLRAVGMVRG